MADSLPDNQRHGSAAPEGWGGMAEATGRHDPETQQQTERAFARCFSGQDGARVLAHLRAITLERGLGPAASDAAVRHLEGQRCLVLHIRSLVDRGCGHP